MILEKERVTPLSLNMILECGSIWSGTLARGSSCCRVFFVGGIWVILEVKGAVLWGFFWAFLAALWGEKAF